MLNFLTKSCLSLCIFLLLGMIGQAQTVVCYVNGSSDSNYVYASGSASIPYGSTSHLTNLKLKITSAYGRTSQTYTSGYSTYLSMSFLDANGEYEDGNYSFLLEAEGNCYYNSSVHAMGSGYTSITEPPKIFVDSFAVSPTQVPYYGNSSTEGNFTASITSTKSLKNVTVQFYVGLVATTCGTTTGGASGTCPPNYTVSPDIGTDVAVTLMGVTPVSKSWKLRNTGSNNGTGGSVTLRVGTEATNAPTAVVTNNWREATAQLIVQ